MSCLQALIELQQNSLSHIQRQVVFRMRDQDNRFDVEATRACARKVAPAECSLRFRADDIGHDLRDARDAVRL